MPKIAVELSDAVIRRLGAGKHSVGGVPGLMLWVSESGARSWVLRVTAGANRRDIGLGGYPGVTLSQARQRAREVRESIWRGVDPIAARKAAKSALMADQVKAVTFADLAKEYVNKKAREFKTAKQRQKLETQLAKYAIPEIGKLVVGDISRAHVERVLRPIWEEKNETASRVRLHIERILDLAGVKGLRAGDNPARWKGNLALSFAAQAKVAPVTHLRALPVADMPAFMADLRAMEGMGARALEFAILTAARSGEVRGATWPEIDKDKALWTIPASRMKGGKAHRVPLTADALRVLAGLPRFAGSHLVFQSSRGTQLSDMTVSAVCRRMGVDAVPHGFRATFRTWAQEFTSYPEEVVELALAHVNSDATRAAYARSELIDKRRLLMDDWARFCRHGAPGGDVVPIRGRA
ncbi:MAG: tyrosine-type recombinase/integrase [Porticoccaceae bacterium]